MKLNLNGTWQCDASGERMKIQRVDGEEYKVLYDFVGDRFKKCAENVILMIQNENTYFICSLSNSCDFDITIKCKGDRFIKDNLVFTKVD